MNTMLHLQNKIAKDSDPLKFQEEDLILKVGECLDVSSSNILVMLI